MTLADQITRGAVAAQYRPYLIAEAGVNHEGRMDLAMRLIAEAKAGGADAIKFQTYKAETIAIKNSPAYWDTTKESTPSQFELFKKYDSFWKEEYIQLKQECDRVGIDFLSTPFDVESAKFLAPLMSVMKISSSDITNRPFIEFLCSLGKPILLSTGASTLAEMHEAVSWIRASKTPLALMHCVLNYPTADENANLGMIPVLQQQFPDLVIGYSDHTMPDNMLTLSTATLLGARILEKHFTFDKTLPGNDHYHAMDQHDIKQFCAHMEKIRHLVGHGHIGALPSEEPARKHARRSLVTTHPLAAGTKIQASDLTWKRPAHGISPRHYYDVLGRTVRHGIEADTPLNWWDLDE